jgi:mannose-6-phosphate isomerase-like protein (cupin superfamily)
MKHGQTAWDDEFAVLFGNERAQAAVMVVRPGDSVGGPDNRHRGSDQWLFVVSGRGSATVAGQRLTLQPGTILLIERGEAHETRNAGDEELRTLSVYVPPAYTAGGETLPSGDG